MSYLNRFNGYAPTGLVNNAVPVWHDASFCPRVYGGKECWCDLYRTTWRAGNNLMKEVSYRDGTPAV